MVLAPSQVFIFIWARNHNGLSCRQKYDRRKSNELQWFGSPRRYRCWFEPGITMVWGAAKGAIVEKTWIIPAANPTNSSHPGRPSQGCIAQHYVHRSHAWHLQLRNAKKSAGPERCRIPWSFLLKKWSIWRLFGLRVVPKLSKRFRDLAAGPRSEIGQPGKVPNSFKLSIEKVIDLETFGPPSGPKASSSLLSSETMKKH